jgi:hypothetical protein
MNVTDHLNTINNDLQGKYKPISKMFDSARVFSVRLQLWEDQLMVHNFVHSPHLKSVEIIFPGSIQKYSRSIFLL